jgi:hypothetical protein
VKFPFVGNCNRRFNQIPDPVNARHFTPDIVMICMDQKSDHREIRVAKVGAWTMNSRTENR